MKKVNVTEKENAKLGKGGNMKKVMVSILMVGVLIFISGCTSTSINVKNNATNQVYVVIPATNTANGYLNTYVSPAASCTFSDKITESTFEVKVWKLNDGVDFNITGGTTVYAYPPSATYWTYIGNKTIATSPGFLCTKFNDIKLIVNSDYSIATN